MKLSSNLAVKCDPRFVTKLVDKIARPMRSEHADVENMAALFQKVNCTNCQEEINGVRVQCCECIDFDICLQCFSSGAEIGPHRNDHSYRLVDQCSAGVFGGKDTWSGQEELQLLEAMDLYGFGSWEYVSRHIKTRSPEEVKEKYIAKYLDGTIGKATWNEIGDCRPVLSEHTSEDTGPLAPEVTSRLPPLDIKPEEAAQLGYVAYRDDFEREYDVSAETLVSSLQLKMNEDSKMEMALKLAQIDMYTRRLRERCRRKRLVRDYQLVAKFFADERKDMPKTELTKNQKELRENMKPFSQFLTSGEHQRLIESIERQRALKNRLAELMRYRSLGLTTQDEILHYEQHLTFEKQQSLRNHKAGSSGYETITERLESGKEEESPSSIEKRWPSRLGAEPDSSSSSSNSNSSSNSKANDQVPHISSLPHANALTKQELALCTHLHLLPVHYRILKLIIIQDYLNSNGKQKDPAIYSNGSEKGPPTTVKDLVTEYLCVSGELSKYSPDS